MATRLNQVLTFTAIAPTVIAALPHSINVNGVQVAPDFVLRDNGDFTILSCTDTTLTVRNDGAAIATLNAWLERQHTIERVYGAAQTTDLAPQPFVPAAGGGGGGAPQAVIFDDAVPADRVNIRSDRASNQSPIDNTLTQITNLGSQDLLENPAALGVTAQGGTIGGGDDNTVSGFRYGTVAGGAGNKAASQYSTVGGGQLNTANNGYSTVSGGRNNLAQADVVTIAGGADNDCDGDYGVISGGRANIIVGGATAYAHIGGGHDNVVQAGGGSAAVIAGGINNLCATGAVFQPVISGGTYNEARASWAMIPGGFAVKTTLPGQHAIGVGGFSTSFPQVAGEAQTSTVVYRGQTPGLAVNESIALLAGDNGSFLPDTFLTLEDGKAYVFKVSVVAGGIQGIARHTRGFEMLFNVMRNAGVSVITAIATNVNYGDAGSATWTMTPSIGAAPDRVVLTFNTGVGAATAAHVVARVEFTEVAF